MKKDGVMESDIKKLKQKHKSFIDIINNELLVGALNEQDKIDLLDTYLKKIKNSKIKNKKEKEKIVRSFISIYETAISYKDWLDEFDAPRWYLEKTYPIFYKHFEKKFNQFIKDWASKTGENKIHIDYKKDLFIFYCRMITAEIEAEDNFKYAIEYVEKNGYPKLKHNEIRLIKDTFDEVINILFELPELIIASFDPQGKVFEESQKQFQENQKNRDFTPGCYLKDRQKGNLDSYIKVAKLIKVFDVKFSYITGIQKKACDIVGCDKSSLSKWKNYKFKGSGKRLNSGEFSRWQNEITGDDSPILENEIIEYLKK